MEVALMFVFFSDRLGCVGSLLLSLGVTLLILALIFLL
jgi:hypothetical protein